MCVGVMLAIADEQVMDLTIGSVSARWFAMDIPSMRVNDSPL